MNILTVADIAVMLALMAGRLARETTAIVNEGRVRVTPLSLVLRTNVMLSGRLIAGDLSSFVVVNSALQPPKPNELQVSLGLVALPMQLLRVLFPSDLPTASITPTHHQRLIPPGMRNFPARFLTPAPLMARLLFSAQMIFRPLQRRVTSSSFSHQEALLPKILSQPISCVP